MRHDYTQSDASLVFQGYGDFNMWDFNIQTDHAIQHRMPSIVLLYKNAVPGDKRIELKEQEKIKFRHELVVPVVIGALGVTQKRLKDWQEKLNIESTIGLLQKLVLLVTAKIEGQA